MMHAMEENKIDVHDSKHLRGGEWVRGEEEAPRSTEWAGKAALRR